MDMDDIIEYILVYFAIILYFSLPYITFGVIWFLIAKSMILPTIISILLVIVVIQIIEHIIIFYIFDTYLL